MEGFGPWRKLTVLLLLCCGPGNPQSTPELGSWEAAYEWSTVDFTWPGPEAREAALISGDFVPANNLVTGIAVRVGREEGEDDEVYVSVPRWRPGVPATLARVVVDLELQATLLEPFPSWSWQTPGDCSSLQWTHGMAIDPSSGYMWVLDTGRVTLEGGANPNSPDPCPAMLRVFNLNDQGALVHQHEFSREVAAPGDNLINDLVLDIDGNTGFVYITDAGLGPTGHKGGLIVYNYAEDKSYRYEHASMLSEENSNLNVGGRSIPLDVGIDGIALSVDRRYLFYCPLGGYHLYQLPTSVIQQPEADLDPHVRDLGAKVSHSDGIIMGHKRLYFGALGLQGVYFWDYKADMRTQSLPLDQVKMETQTELAIDPEALAWPDSFTLDDNGFLWTTVNSFAPGGDPVTIATKINVRIIKIAVGDASYLSQSHDMGEGDGSSNRCNTVMPFSCSLLFVLLLSTMKQFCPMVQLS